jgi:hypothetical protein
MKLVYLATAASALALAGGAAYAQQTQPAAPTPGSVTGDWNGSHAPSDDKQYQEKVTVPVGAPASAASEAPAADVPADTTAGASGSIGTDVTAPTGSAANTSATFTNMTVTNGPVPDTAENRAKYGSPMSNAGKKTAPRGN